MAARSSTRVAKGMILGGGAQPECRGCRRNSSNQVLRIYRKIPKSKQEQGIAAYNMISGHKDTEDVGSRKKLDEGQATKDGHLFCGGRRLIRGHRPPTETRQGARFLVRLLDTRVNILYERLTAQNDITPRQFGVLLTLYQQGTLTLRRHGGDADIDLNSSDPPLPSCVHRVAVPEPWRCRRRPQRRS